MCMTSLMWILPKIKQQSISILISNQKKKTGVWFSPEKHRLFKEISNESTQKCGAKIKRIKLQDFSSDLITHYTAVKKRKLDFEPRTLQLQYTDITTIMNELA